MPAPGAPETWCANYSTSGAHYAELRLRSGVVATVVIKPLRPPQEMQCGRRLIPAAVSPFPNHTERFTGDRSR